MNVDAVTVDTPAPVKDRLFLSVIVVAVVGVIAYANSFENEFVWDDASSILLHKDVRLKDDPENPDQNHLLNIFTRDQHYYGRGQGNFYRPLLSLSFLVDFWLAYTPPPEGVEEPPIPIVSPAVFHATSLMWHLAASILLLLVFRRLGAPDAVALVAALLYTIHPLHTEAVTYISGRGDSMAATFMFAGLLAALGKVASSAMTIPRAAATVLLFTLALLSKESAAIFPVLLALVLVAAPSNAASQPRMKRFVPVIAAFCILAAYAILRTSVLRFGIASQESTTGLFTRLTESFMAFALYIKLLFIPTGLHMERTLDGVPPIAAFAGLLLLSGCVVLCLYGIRKKNRLVAVGMAWFLITWLPISGIVPLNAPMAEHWLYVPMAGFWLAVLALVWPLAARPMVRPVAIALLAVLSGFFLAQTIDRNKDWRTNESIYNATLEKNPNSLRVQYNLAVTYSDLTHNTPGAIRHYMNVLDAYEARREALPVSGDTVPVWDQELESRVSLGRIFLEANRYDQAGQHFSAVLGAQPNERNRDLIAYAAFGLGKCYLAVGEAQRAREYFDRAIELDPTFQTEVDQLMPQTNQTS